MKKYLSFKYPFIVWIGTLFFAPIFFSLFSIMFHGYKSADFGIITIIMFFILGLLFSIPAFVIYFLSFSICDFSGKGILFTKTISIIVSVSTIFIAFYCFFSASELIPPYAIVTIIFGIFIKV